MSKQILDLNSRVTVSRGEYTILPEAVYECVVEKVDDWVVKSFTDVNVNLRGDDGRILKDTDGNIIREKMSFDAYSANITLRVVDGEFEGRKIFANVTTHPNVIFLLEGFIYAIKENKDLLLSELQKVALNKRIAVDTYHRTYTRTRTNPETGLDYTEDVTNVSVRSFMRPRDVAYDKFSEEVAGL